MKKQDLIIVRGAGDLATGTICRLAKSGFRLLVLETVYPAAIRRQVALSEAVYEGSACVEGVTAVQIEAVKGADAVWARGQVPVLVDPVGDAILALKPAAVVDAILAKRNLGTTRAMAPLTIENVLCKNLRAGAHRFVAEEQTSFRQGSPPLNTQPRDAAGKNSKRSSFANRSEPL